MKTICKFFLGLAIFLLLIQPLNAEELNPSSNYSEAQVISFSQVSTNLTFNEMASTARPSVEVSTSQLTPSVQPSNITGTASTGKAPVTFTTDPVTKREYVTDQVIVRFKSQKNDGPSISNDKI